MPDRSCKSCGEPLDKSRSKQARYCSDKCGCLARSRAFYARNNQSEKLRRESYRDTHYARGVISRLRYRATKLGIPFSITPDDIVPPAECPILGMSLHYNYGRKGYHPDSPSVDRIRPELGYVTGNVRVISARANLLKSNATVDEIKAVLTDLKAIHNA